MAENLVLEDYPVKGRAIDWKKAEEEADRQVYADLALLLYDIAEGSDSFIWNGMRWKKRISNAKKGKSRSWRMVP